MVVLRITALRRRYTCPMYAKRTFKHLWERAEDVLGPKKPAKHEQILHSQVTNTLMKFHITKIYNKFSTPGVPKNGL